ncbi:MAG: ribosome small subunit-dependent GTPase A [Planctomycetes bacterium]|nr:ribosome small subunit-dependent GTPase A [Planctomycetota bacterium]
MNHKLREIGWKPFFEQQVELEDPTSVIIARVSAHHRSQVLLLGEAGEFHVPVQLAESAGPIAVGDWVVLNADDQRVIQRLERTTLLHRKASGEEVKAQTMAANVDTIFIVSSCNEDFNLSRLERYLALALQAEITPVIVLTKSDLCDDAIELRQQAQQLHNGVVVETVDARCPQQAEVLSMWCGLGQTVALLGSSGVGKSTLANTLGVGDLATGGIREQDGKGRHTTTARSLHLLPSGGVLVDNPGIRELQLPACEEGISDLFDDIIQLGTQCKFRDCSHDEDVGCAIQGALESGDLDERRWQSFQKLNAEQAHNSRTLAERRERDRNMSKMYREVIASKKRRPGG